MTYQTTNDFDLTRQDGTYTGATGELVVSDGGTITLPTPTAGEKFGVRALRNDVTLLSNGSIEASTSDRRIDSEGNSVFVSDGTEWYLVSGNEYFGFDIRDSVVNHWPTDDGSGSTLTDNQGTADGTISGATWVSDSAAVGGHYLSYDGTDDHVALPPSTLSYTTAGDYTLTAWVNPSISDRQAVLAYHENGGAGVSLEMSASGNLQLTHHNVAFVESSLSIPTGQWSFVAGRWDDSAGQATFDVNDASDTVTASSPNTPSNPVSRIGSIDATAFPWSGNIDETTGADTALSDSDIQQLRDRR